MPHRKRQADWLGSPSGVEWCDVWDWTAELRDRFGLWARIEVSPPLPHQEATVALCVTLHTVRYLEGGKAHETRRAVTIRRGSRETLEGVSLQLVAALVMRLDHEQIEAERAAALTLLL